jgi:NADPH-dependent curcumin reductase CurA
MAAAREIVLRRYPEGAPAPEDFEARACEIPNRGPGEVLIEVTHLSMDPFPRLRMQERSGVGPPMALDHFVEGRGLGRVVASDTPDLPEGCYVSGELGWRTHAALPANALSRVDLSLGPLERQLSAIGPSGLAAYFAMHIVGAPREGETVVIAPAAGAVGSLAGQIAKAAGARVVGLAASTQVAALKQAGFDEAADHRALDDLSAACPDGVDLFLDGVGGAVHDAVVAALRPHGRVVLLGFISGYNDRGPPRYGSAAPILFKRARMEGFLLADWQDRFDEGLCQLAAWCDQGTIRPLETIWEGLDQAPAAFASLFGDAPPGKQIVRIVRGD